MRSKTIGEVIAEGRLRTFMDPRLVKALGHPVREHILAVLNERIASPKEIGLELGLAVEDFYHHFEVLEDLGCIERVKAKRRRGATEHFFRATTCVLIDDSEWARLPETLKSDLSAELIKPIAEDVVAAIEGQTFSSRDDSHASWIPGRLDGRAWHEMVVLLKETMWRAIEIRDRSALRLSTSDEEGMPATVAILGFETPSRAPVDAEAAIDEPVAAHV